MLLVDLIDIKASPFEEHAAIAGSWAALTVTGVISLVQVRFHFDDPSRAASLIGLSDQQLSQQLPSCADRRVVFEPSLFHCVIPSEGPYAAIDDSSSLDSDPR
jgi:hypothetical protein